MSRTLPFFSWNRSRKWVPSGRNDPRVSPATAPARAPVKHRQPMTARSRSPRSVSVSREAISARVGGTVYVLVRIGRDGTVQEAIAEQVNLDSYGSEAQMKHYRKLLSDSALEAAGHWTYNQPRTGPNVDDPYWTARIPVTFYLVGPWAPSAKHYGQWETYLPGPRQTPPWTGKALANESPDAMSGDELRTGDPRLQLITPVDGA